MTMQALVARLVDEAIGAVDRHTEVIRPTGGEERLIELAERQVELLEQLVEKAAKNPVNSVMPPASASAENSVMPVVAVDSGSAVDAQQLVAGVRARSQAELDQWLGVSEAAEGSVVITPSPGLGEERAKRKGNPAFAEALRAAAADVVDAEAAEGADVQAALLDWRRATGGAEGLPTAPVIEGAGVEVFIEAARAVAMDRGKTASIAGVRECLRLWGIQHELLDGEIGEVLAGLPTWEELGAG